MLKSEIEKAPTCRGVDSKRPLKVSCSIWHQDISSRSFKSCRLQGGAANDRTCGPAHPTDAHLDGDLGSLDWRPGQHLEFFIMFLKSFLNNVCSVAGHAERDHFHQGTPLS